MSASTSPDNITYPVSTDSFGPLETQFATMAASVQTAFNTTKTYRTADLNSLATITAMASGALATVIEGGAIFGYNGTIWVQNTEAIFASAATRDTAYAKNAGAYRVSGALVYRSDLMALYIYNGTAWVQRVAVKHNGAAGSAIAGVATPVAVVDITSAAIFQTGQLVAGTTVSFGNEYFPSVTFATAFPTACVSILITPISGSSITQSVGVVNIDTMNTTSFRALITSSANPWVRGFLWTAIGY